MSEKVGKVSQIIGPVVDVSFDTSTTDLPKIYDSLEVSKQDGSVLVLEVQSHVGDDYMPYAGGGMIGSTYYVQYTLNP